MNILRPAGMALFIVLWIGRTGLSLELPLIYPAMSVSDAPVLDGQIDDAVWRNVYPAGGFVVLGKPGTTALKQTAFRVVYTTNALYVAVECREPDMDKLQIASQELCNVDSVEIFIQPKAGGQYWQMVISSDGGREEYRNMKNNPDISSWDAKVYRGADFYSMEVKLPFATAFISVDNKPPFNLFAAWPGPGEEWRFNIARNTTTTNSDRYSTWSHLTGGFHDPGNFGKVVFSGAGIDTAAMKHEMFKRRYKAMDAWITAYRDMYRKYDHDFFDYITKFLVEIGWEELRQKSAKIDRLSPENVERAEKESKKVAGRLSELEGMREEILKKRLFGQNGR